MPCHPLTLDISAAVDTYLNVDNDDMDDVEKLKTTYDDPQTLSNISLADLVNYLSFWHMENSQMTSYN